MVTKQLVGTVYRLVQVWEPEDLLEVEPDADFTVSLGSKMDMERHAKVVASFSKPIK